MIDSIGHVEHPSNKGLARGFIYSRDARAEGEPAQLADAPVNRRLSARK